MPLTSAHEWSLFTVLVAAAAVGNWAESTKWGARLSGAIIAMGIPFAMSNVGMIPFRDPVYDAVWAYLVPMAIPLLLFRANLRRLLRESGRTLLAFTCGGIGTAVGTIIAYHFIDLGSDGWKVASALCATYIGGSINFAAVVQSVGLLPGDTLAAAAAADGVIALVYFLVLFSLPSLSIVKRSFAAQELGHFETGVQEPSDEPLTVRGTLAALALSGAICSLGFASAHAFEAASSAILFVTAFAVLLATVAPRMLERLVACEQIGMLFMSVFFAVIGASADIGAVVRVGGAVFSFAASIVATHLLVTLTTGWLLRLRLAEVLLASNACVGGPTTAAAMATACRWRTLVGPAILCGTLGYATATFVGIGLGGWLHYG